MRQITEGTLFWFHLCPSLLRSSKSRGNGSARPAKLRQTARTTAASSMTSCRPWGLARSSTRTCPRWSATASASTARTRTRAERGRSQSSTSNQGWGHHLRTISRTLAPPSGSTWHAHSFAPSSIPTQFVLTATEPHTSRLDLSSWGLKPKAVTNDQTEKCSQLWSVFIRRNRMFVAGETFPSQSFFN